MLCHTCGGVSNFVVGILKEEEKKRARALASLAALDPELFYTFLPIE